ncbi:MAG TPA: GyrI-like domain-containing protein [Anaerolineaceae bacterium]|nr:GyrI-like domain-containing protein [Anaerolineaceae bacterium]
MVKQDLKQVEKELYTPSAKIPSLVEVPEMQFLMIDGCGAPADAGYRNAVQALYSLSYALKFRIKKGDGLDYTVLPLEGLWWVDDLSQLSMTERGNWKWTAMIRQPDRVTEDMLAEARAEALRKKGLAAIEQARLARFHEGLAAQVMHIGPYSAEQPTIELLHDFVEGAGLRLRGKHHEIYMGDPNRTAPEKLKTILRHPVERV